jgi:hypothetical protein
MSSSHESTAFMAADLWCLIRCSLYSEVNTTQTLRRRDHHPLTEVYPADDGQTFFRHGDTVVGGTVGRPCLWRISNTVQRQPTVTNQRLENAGKCQALGRGDKNLFFDGLDQDFLFRKGSHHVSHTAHWILFALDSFVSL